MLTVSIEKPLMMLTVVSVVQYPQTFSRGAGSIAPTSPSADCVSGDSSVIREKMVRKGLLTKVRAYGWYCPHCKAHKDIEQVSVVKVTKGKYMTMICLDCHTEVVDCFLLTIDRSCDSCPDRFRCYTRSDATTEKELQNVKAHEIRSLPDVIDPRNIVGVRSYTGIYNTKLDEEFCRYPERDDCNHSWMRQNYSGDGYTRCPHMKYRIQEHEWYCWYSEVRRP